MDLIASTSNVALVGSLLLLVSMLWMRRRHGPSPRQRVDDRLDTVQDWPAQLGSVMTPPQRKAHDLLRLALPGRLILVQVPLAQFVHVPTRHSYVEWHKRAGRLRVSFLVCDVQSNPIAGIDLRPFATSERESARRARLVRVLEAAGLTMCVWTEDSLPSLAQVRARLATLPGSQTPPLAPAPAVSLEPAGRLSGAADAMSMEATDFAGLTTLPAPFDEGGAPSAAVRSPRAA